MLTSTAMIEQASSSDSQRCPQKTSVSEPFSTEPLCNFSFGRQIAKMRGMTVVTFWRMLREGSSGSAASSVTTSMLVMEKITTATQANSETTAWGRKPAIFGEVDKASGGVRPEVEGIGAGDDQEDDDGRDLDPGEPILGLTKELHQHQVQQRYAAHQPKVDGQHRRAGEPAASNLPPDHGLEAEYDPPKATVQPAGHVAGRAIERHARVIDEGTLGSMRDDDAGDEVCDESTRPSGANHCIGADEQPCADNVA